MVHMRQQCIHHTLQIFVWIDWVNSVVLKFLVNQCGIAKDSISFDIHPSPIITLNNNDLDLYW